jgi:Na+/melibiose symporter-like transporter
MPIRPGPRKSPIASHPITSAIIAILIAGSILCTLIVPIYASITPKVGDWPFFYFYLLASIPFVVIALCVTVLLQRRLNAAAETAQTAQTAGAGE